MVSHLTSRMFGCRVSLSFWEGPGRRETHAVVTAETGGSFSVQVEAVEEAVAHLTWRLYNDGTSQRRVMTRWYVSDIMNQSSRLKGSCVVGQAPTGDCKVSVLAIFMKCSEVDSSREGETAIVRGEYTDIRHHIDAAKEDKTYSATHDFFSIVCESLARRGATLGDNCVRTWFFVNDIDNKYWAFVRSRNEVFEREGLTRDTHFIASTGIGASLCSSLHSESLSVIGLQAGQISYLSSPSRMNSTADYGVSFERGTCVDYGDRRVTYVSGTASIGPEGEIMHVGDPVAQTERMIGNVESLLSKGGVSKTDIMHIVVYVRDLSYGEEVISIVRGYFPGIPCVAVQGAVCRPGWLVEMECMAMTALRNSRYACY